MARLIALYKTPKDPAAFDRYYFATHAPLAKKIPGLRKYEVSQGGVQVPEAHRATTSSRRCISTAWPPSRQPWPRPRGRRPPATSATSPTAASSC